METEILLDVCEDAFERIGGVGNVELWVAKVGEEVWEIPPHTVVSTPKSAVRVVPSSCEFIGCSLFQERPPLVMPEFEPEDELIFANQWEVTHEGLQFLSRFEFRTACHVACDNGGLMEVAHLDRHGKSLQ